MAKKPWEAPAQVGVSFPNPRLRTGRGRTRHQEGRGVLSAQSVETPAALHDDSVAKVPKDLLAFFWCDCDLMRQGMWWGRDVEQHKGPCSCTRCPGGGCAATAPRRVRCLVFCCDGAWWQQWSWSLSLEKKPSLAWQLCRKHQSVLFGVRTF